MDRFELTQPAQDDQYDIGVYGDNLRKLAENALKSTEITALRVLTKDGYQSLARKDEQTLYVVTGQGDFAMYLGTAPMQGGSIPLSLETIRSFGTLGVTGAETEMEV